MNTIVNMNSRNFKVAVIFAALTGFYYTQVYTLGVTLNYVSEFPDVLTVATTAMITFGCMYFCITSFLDSLVSR